MAISKWAAPVVLAALAVSTTSRAQSAPTFAQAITVPAYFDNSGGLWTTMDGDYPAIGNVIANINSGPGSSKSTTWATIISNAQASGISVLGYIFTGYADSTNHDYQTLAQAEAMVDSWYTWYSVDGIMVDETSTDCTKETNYYLPLYNYIKAKGGKAIVQVNPGTRTNECYMSAADIVQNFEGSYATYSTMTWSSGWESNYDPSRFFHGIHTTSTTANMTNAISLSQARNAGWVYVTDASGTGNTYGSFSSYMTTGTPTEVTAVQPVYRWRAKNDGTNAYLKFNYNGGTSTWYFKRAYLDTDQSASTGYQVRGIGANYLIENTPTGSTLYSYSGTGTNWSWTSVKTLTTTSTSSSIEWTVARSDIGKTGFPTSQDIVYEVSPQAGPNTTMYKYTQTFSVDSTKVTAYWAENDTNIVYYSSTFPQTYSFYHVFIDTDKNSSTGYTVPNTTIGADYMIENGRLKKYSGTGGNNWAWTTLGTSNEVINGTVHTWWAWRKFIGKTNFSNESVNIVFAGSGNGQPDYNASLYTDYSTQ